MAKPVQPVSLSLGGSILAPAQPDPAFLKRVAASLAAWSKERPLVVVVGGGHPARTAINAARTAGVPEADLDRIGIAATRLNAQSLIALCKSAGADVNAEIPLSAAQALRFAAQNALVVMGGTVPGHSTDYVAVEVAAESGGRCVIGTNVDGVYTSDPKTDPAAKRLARISAEELRRIVGDTKWKKAGSPGVIDGPGVELLRKRKVPVCVVKADDLESLGLAVAGKPFHGTLVGDPS